MKRVFIATLLLLQGFWALAQSDQSLQLNWTNGTELFVGEKSGSSLLFRGGNLGEGGYNFALKVNADKTYTIVAHDDAPEPSFGSIGESVEVKTIQGKKYLIAKNSKGEVTALLEGVSSNSDLWEIVIEHRMKFDISGVYQSNNGKTVVFGQDKSIKGLDLGTSLSFPKEYDMANGTVTIGSKKYFLIKSEGGLQLFDAKKEGDEGDWYYEEGEPLYTFKKTEHTNSQGLKGKYTFASTDVLTTAAIDAYSKTELKQMRNEIYARYGMIFKTDEMKNYFAAQSWYKGTSADVTSKLTEVEKLNVRLIQLMEAQK